MLDYLMDDAPIVALVAILSVAATGVGFLFALLIMTMQGM